MTGRVKSEIPDIANDERLVELLSVGTEAAVVANVQMLEHDIDAKLMAMPGTVAEYARVVAQHGHPVSVLEHGSRLTRNVILHWCLEQLGEPGSEPEVVARAAVDLMTRLTAWTDELYRGLLDVYEGAHEAWLRHRTAARSARIDDLVNGRPVDVAEVETTLSYSLGQRHLGALAWLDPSERNDDLARLDRAITKLAHHLHCPSAPLFEPRDGRTAWVWFPLESHAQVDFSQLTSILDQGDRSIVIALGAVQAEREGFVRSHEQAVQAATVARASQVNELHVVPFEDVGAVALMCTDLALTRRWVLHVLGPLAEDEPTVAEHRDTLRIFLASGGSYTTTALSLTMHKNSVVYRIRKIEELLGRSVRERRIDLENALSLCNWLGASVLSSTSEAH